MFYNNLDPVLFRLFGLEVRWYGVIYALSFVIAYFMIRKLAREKNFGLKEGDVESLIVYYIVGVVVGARIFEILFYNPGFYFSNPLEMVAIWHGGLSFHGGLVGALIAAYIFCKRYGVKFLDLADISVLPAAIGLFLGRIANFINGEVYGTVTDVPWAVKFKGVEGFRHPVQLYESGKNLVIFFVLWFVKDKKWPRGTLFALFLILYSIIRFFLEFFKEPEATLGPLTMGQALSIPMFIAGVWLFIRGAEK